MKEHTKQKLVFANESIKQLITLSTAILTVSVAFKEKVLSMSPQAIPWFLVLSLVAQMISVFFGIRALQGMAQVLEDCKDDDEPSIHTDSIRKPAAVQVKAFVWGLSFMIVYFALATLQ